MRRLVSLFVIAIFLLSLISCTAENETVIDADELLERITSEYSLDNGFIFSSSSVDEGGYLDEDLLMSYYGDTMDYPDLSKVSDYCVYIDESDPKSMTEVGVFHLNDKSYGDTLLGYFKARINDRLEKAKVYTDMDSDMMKKAVFKKKGSYVYYVVSYSVDGIVSLIDSSIK